MDKYELNTPEKPNLGGDGGGLVANLCLTLATPQVGA